MRQPIGISNKVGQDWDSEAMGHIIKTAVLLVNAFLFLSLTQQSRWQRETVWMGFFQGLPELTTKIRRKESQHISHNHIICQDSRGKSRNVKNYVVEVIY